jgi:hypothetical protein
MSMLTSHKNVIFDTLVANQLIPSQFLLEDKAEGFTLTFLNTPYYFEATLNPENRDKYFHLVFSPSEYQLKEILENYNGTFNALKYFINKWCLYLKREISEDDKWARLDQEIKSSHISFEAESDKFSFQEYVELETKMAALKDQIKLIPLEPAQLDAINNKLDHLTEQAKVLSKFDWKSMFVGTFISIIIQLSVSPANAKSLWDLIKQVFSGYFLN